MQHTKINQKEEEVVKGKNIKEYNLKCGSGSALATMDCKWVCMSGRVRSRSGCLPGTLALRARSVGHSVGETDGSLAIYLSLSLWLSSKQPPDCVIKRAYTL